MTTFKQKILAGEIKRADAMKVRFEDLHVEPGFNLRIEGEDLEVSIDALAAHIIQGGQYPALEVRPRSDGGVFIVDGHRRHRAIAKAIEAGAQLKDKDGVVWVRVEAFTGNDADRVARIMTSAEGRGLSPLETAMGYKRLAAYGWDSDRIATTVGKTRTHVDGLLILANAPSEVQNQVATGTVSAAVAVDLVRKHGDNAGKVLAGEMDKAKAQGKRKVTAGTIKGKALPRPVLDQVVDATDALVDALDDDARKQLAGMERQENAPYRDGLAVSVPAWALLELMQAHAKVTEAKAADAQRVRDAQAKAAQQEIAA